MLGALLVHVYSVRVCVQYFVAGGGTACISCVQYFYTFLLKLYNSTNVNVHVSRYLQL